MERLLEEVSFSASDMAIGDKKELVIDRAYVEQQLDELAKDVDLKVFKEGDIVCEQDKCLVNSACP